MTKLSLSIYHLSLSFLENYYLTRGLKGMEWEENPYAFFLNGIINILRKWLKMIVVSVLCIFLHPKICSYLAFRFQESNVKRIQATFASKMLNPNTRFNSHLMVLWNSEWPQNGCLMACKALLDIIKYATQTTCLYTCACVCAHTHTQTGRGERERWLSFMISCNITMICGFFFFFC